MTVEERLNRMLNRVSNTLDKRKGSMIYLTLASVAEELTLQDEEIEEKYDQTFADTAVSDELTRRAAERGVNRKQASVAIRKAKFNITVPVGSRFGVESTTYIVTENLENYESKLECEQLGGIGNAYVGNLLPITFIAGLTLAQLTDILIPGEDLEDDESLRKRYYERIESEAFGGNKAEYKIRAKNLQGVDGVKVYPAWAGGGTVKLMIIDSTLSKPSTELIDTVQNTFDPVTDQGEGIGLAPIGHVVTVVGVEELIINISSIITLNESYVWVDVKPYIEEVINEYFLTLRKTWEDENALIVRISQIDSAILQVNGVVDISGTTLNGWSTNLVLTDAQIPILGMVTI